MAGRDGQAGRLPATMLFKEFRGLYCGAKYAEIKERVEAIYSTEEFRKVFLECEDLTEYEPALKLVGDWREWERLKRDSQPFRIAVQEWRAELQRKLQSAARRKMLDLAKNGSESAKLQATKWLAAHAEGKSPSKRGRPKKADIEAAAREQAADSQRTKDELERIEGALRNGEEGTLQ